MAFADSTFIYGIYGATSIGVRFHALGKSVYL
jgi:hypothetical protein